jgi:NADH-quinone oxidoreductase subunit F
VDLHLIPGAEPSAEERTAVDAVAGPPESGWEGGARRPEIDGHLAAGGHAARARRHLMLPVLWAVQSRVGWISPGALNYVCRRLSVAPADAYGVATFYAMLSVEPQPKTIVHVCDDLACGLAGGPDLLESLRGRMPPDSVRPSPCLGLCERAPAVLIQRAGEGARDEAVAPASGDEVRSRLDDAPHPVPLPEGEGTHHDRRGSTSAPQTLDSRRDGLRLLARVGRVDPESLEDYRAQGGYRALPKALALGPEGVIREVLASKLQGRGGAAFPAGR